MSHWRLLSAEWMDGLDVWDWYQIPAELKPRIFRSTINSIRCRNGRVVAVEMKGGGGGGSNTFNITINPSGITDRTDKRELARSMGNMIQQEISRALGGTTMRGRM